MPYVIGLNSGSSFDGIDAVLIELSIGPDGHPTKPKFLKGITVDWPKELQEPIIRAFENKLSIFELCRLNYAAGAAYVNATKRLLKEYNLNPKDVDVIGYDGQTVYQEPIEREKKNQISTGTNVDPVDFWLSGGYPCGLFIVESGVVAALTDITTVTQFRPVDHALGGCAAPLMQYLDFVSFREIGPVLTLNIGGIANIQLADQDRSRMMAFDTGPGNVMIDHIMKKRLEVEYDKNGDTGAKGTEIREMLEELQSHPFLTRPPPRSAWRLDFGSQYCEDMLKKYSTYTTEDLVATVTRFSACAIVNAIRDYVLPRVDPKTIIVSGGGARNKTLISKLQEELQKYSITVEHSDQYSVPGAYKEAIKFATLAFATKNQLANNIPAAGGASSFAILGKLTHAPRLARNTL